MMSHHTSTGPGIAKVRHPSAVRRRVLEMWGVIDAYWAHGLDHADLVSEGAVSEELGVEVYRGTTSILLTDDEHGGEVPAWDVRDLVRLARHDPHFRLRITRAARREAQSRAPGPLSCLNMEINIFVDPRGMRADIDVEGQVWAARLKVKGER